MDSGVSLKNGLRCRYFRRLKQSSTNIRIIRWRRPTGKYCQCTPTKKTNSYLKEIASLCEISKNLTFHLARHTFATTVTLANGVPIESVSKMLGHTSLRTTGRRPGQIYAKVVEQKLSEDMQALQDKLSGAADQFDSRSNAQIG